LHHKLKGSLGHGDAFIERQSFRAVKHRKWDAIVGVFSAEVKLSPVGRGFVEAAILTAPQSVALPASLERAAFLPYPESKMSSLRLRQYSRAPIISGLSIVTVLLTTTSLLNAEPSTAEQAVADAIKTQHLSVVHLWAPWCSNCQAELKGGGWVKMIKDNPNVHFYFVSVWNGGEDGAAMLRKFEITDQPNVTILADLGPRGQNHIKQFAGLPLSWIPTTWIYKGGDLRYALNYGEIRFSVLQQFLEDSQSEWSHKGEPKID
jgi:thiol-disulfide isomerase/thioredoxin